METKDISLVRLIVGFLSGVMLAGCALMRPATTTTETTTTETVTKRDTILVTQADTSLIKAYLYCDSMNMVVMDKMIMKEGELINMQFLLDSFNIAEPHYTIAWLRATVPERFDSISWIERNKQAATVITETVTVKVKEPPWWCKLVMIVETIMLLFWSFYIIKIYLDTKR